MRISLAQFTENQCVVNSTHVKVPEVVGSVVSPTVGPIMSVVQCSPTVVVYATACNGNIVFHSLIFN